VDEDELRDAALKALAEATGDQYTRLLPPLQARTQALDLEGGFFGIGVTIAQNEDGSLRVENVVPFGGAEKAGIQADDVIVAVDGVSILGQPFLASRERIRSNVQDSVVRLSVLRGGNPESGTDSSATRHEIDVVRSRIESWSVHDAHIEVAHGTRYGYLSISDFSANTHEQFKQAVTELLAQGARALIIDLRGNGGGRVDSATALVELLLPEEGQLIAFTRSSRESNRPSDRVLKTQAPGEFKDLPLVVLIDRDSASASELVTAALKDHGRAFVIGERSRGKGLVQSVFRLASDPRYTLNVTTTQYFTPLGRQVQASDDEPGGIKPDLLMPYKHGERTGITNRLRTRQARYNREAAMQSEWWNYEDRMLKAALDVLAGVPAVVR
jgi:carboxyl-terminal processing protease